MLSIVLWHAGRAAGGGSRSAFGSRTGLVGLPLRRATGREVMKGPAPKLGEAKLGSLRTADAGEAVGVWRLSWARRLAPPPL